MLVKKIGGDVHDCTRPQNVDAVACIAYGGERECSIAASCRVLRFREAALKL